MTAQPRGAGAITRRSLDDLLLVGSGLSGAACKCCANLPNHALDLELTGGINIYAWPDVEYTEASMRSEPAQDTGEPGGLVQVADVALPLHEPRGRDFRCTDAVHVHDQIRHFQ